MAGLRWPSRILAPRCRSRWRETHTCPRRWGCRRCRWAPCDGGGERSYRPRIAELGPGGLPNGDSRVAWVAGETNSPENLEPTEGGMMGRGLIVCLVLLTGVDGRVALAQRGRQRLAAPPTAAAVPLDTTVFRGMQWRNIGPFRGGRAVAVSGVRGQPRTYY